MHTPIIILNTFFFSNSSAHQLIVLSHSPDIQHTKIYTVYLIYRYIKATQLIIKNYAEELKHK